MAYYETQVSWNDTGWKKQISFDTSRQAPPEHIWVVGMSGSVHR